MCLIGAVHELVNIYALGVCMSACEATDAHRDLRTENPIDSRKSNKTLTGHDLPVCVRERRVSGGSSKYIIPNKAITTVP